MTGQAGVKIREAQVGDAEAAALVMRRSIEKLCAADHRNDAEFLADWLRNKTAENVRGWIGERDSATFVAARAGRIVGFAMLDATGTVLLLYADPDAVGAGVGKGLLGAMEQRARELGLDRLTLESTKTAREWYERQGFRRPGVSGGRSRSACLPLEKPLR